MNDFAAMGSAIYGRLGTVQYTYSTGGTATATGTLGLYDTLAPQVGGTPPYVIFQLQSSVDDYVMGTGSSIAGESADYLVKVVSNRQYASQQAFAIYNTVHANLQDAPLTIVGGYPLRVRRRRRVEYRDLDGYWHVGGIYRIDRWNT